MKKPRDLNYDGVPGVKDSTKMLVKAVLRKFYLRPADALRFFVRKISAGFFGKPIRVYEYREKEFTNFGDALTSDIIRKLFRKKVEVYHSIPSDKKLDLLGVGSIADWDMFRNISYKIFLWGSGAMHSVSQTGLFTNKNLVFRAVRGKRTRERLTRKFQNIPVGDPGLLANLIYKQEIEQTGKIGVIPHFVDENETVLSKARSDSKKYKIISVKQKPEQVANDIKSCRVIFSSSLHGLIVADSFGVPNIHIPMSDLLGNGSKKAYKFLDYYSATGRSYKYLEPSKIYNTKSIENVIKNYNPIKNLQKIQNDLVEAFPYRRER